MIALQNVARTPKSNADAKPQAGILSERTAIILCGLGVAVFAIPILVVIECLSACYWGGVTVATLLKGSEVDEIDEV